MSLSTIPPPQTAKEMHPNSLEANPDFEIQKRKKLVHKPSGFSRYLNVAASGSLLLTHRNEALLVRRAKYPQTGKLGIPGGFVDMIEENGIPIRGESLEESAVREVREEIGVIIDDPTSLQYVTSGGNAYDYNGHLYFTSDAFFTHEVSEKPEIIIQKAEIAEAVWVALDGTFDLEEMAFDSHKKAFLAVLAKHFQK